MNGYVTRENAAYMWQRKLLLAVLCFAACSFVGHWLEISVSTVLWAITGTGFDAKVTDNVTQPYMIYGAAALVCLFALRPLYLRHRLHPVGLYFLCVSAAAALELVGHQILVMRFGHNPYWDYSDSPLNFAGAICLGNTVGFGIIATGFIMIVCPAIERWSDRQPLDGLRRTAMQAAGMFVLGFVAPLAVMVGYLAFCVLATLCLGRVQTGRLPGAVGLGWRSRARRINGGRAAARRVMGGHTGGGDGIDRRLLHLSWKRSSGEPAA
jgi:hypothetical protein